MRILEVIGSTFARERLWQELYHKAVSSGIKRMRGWEAVVRDFAPGFSLKSMPWAENVAVLDKIHAFERDWGTPMIFLFNQSLTHWLKVVPCPILELDHP